MRVHAFVILVALCFPALRGQATSAEVAGKVTDATGASIVGAKVRLANASTGAGVSYRTSADGEYSFLLVPPGEYRLLANKEGFRPLERERVQLRPGERLVLDLTLEVGDIAQALVVTAEVPLLQQSRGTVAFTLEQERVVTLPLDGRNFVPLLALAPGVTLPPGSAFPRINGGRPRVSEYLYDGISVLQPEPGQPAYYPVIDAIAEFRVETNAYGAEYGRANGGIILVTQKSGTNDLHGTLFEFLRNEDLNARNLFASSGEKPRFRRNQYGFALGGPVRRNRTFFFADWQGTRIQTGVVRLSTVPTTAQRNGIFSQPVYDPATRVAFENGVIPRDRFDPVAAEAMQRYPLPNVFVNGRAATANNYRRVGVERIGQDQFDTRLDHLFGPRHRLFARYSYFRDDSDPVTPLPDGSGTVSTGIIGPSVTRADSAVAEHAWTPSPDIANQVRAGYTRRAFQRLLADSGPSYDVVGYQSLGPSANGNADFATSVTQVTDTFTWVRGGHIWKFGADIRRETYDVSQAPNPAGLFQFSNLLTAGLSPAGTPVPGTGNSVASFLLGQVQSYQADLQTGVLRPRASIAETYVQDEFRVGRRLSFNLGVRHTLNFPSTVEDDRGAVFDLGTQRLDFLGQNGFPRSARNLEKGNFGPRAGAALRLSDSAVVRSGYGLTWIEQAGITTPFTTPLFPFIRTVQQSSPDNLTPAFLLSDGPAPATGVPDADSGLGQSVFGVQRDQKSGYAQQWNLSLQKTFGTTWSVEAGYLGSKLTNLGVPDVNLNQLRVEDLALGRSLLDRVPNPFYGEIPPSSPLGQPTITRQQLLRPYPRFQTVALYRNNIGHSTFHSLQARVQKRFSRGLTFGAAYTFSRLIDDAGAVFDSAILTGPVAAFQAADSYNRRLEKDVSTGNIPHAFAASFIWEFARGWQLAGIARVQSGSPVAVTQQPNSNAFAGFGIQRPNLVRDPSLPSDARSTARWFDTSAFAAAPQFTIGNASRNPVVGPGFQTVDLMIGKTFPITERLRLELRAEAFNSLNTPPLGNPNGAFGTSAFGTITSALDPRVFEIVGKVRF